MSTLTRGRHARVREAPLPSPDRPFRRRAAQHELDADAFDDRPTDLIPRQQSGRHQLFAPVHGPARHRRAVPPTAVAAAVGVLVGATVFAVVGRAMVDDAYITLTYARTLGIYGEWGVYPGVPSNTATSPLNVLLLGGVTAVVRDAVTATGVLLAICYGLVAAWLTKIGVRIGMPAWRAPAAGLALLATSPLMLSTVGLESTLALTLIVGVTERVSARAPWAAGLLAGLLVITRPDLGAVALVAVVVSGRDWWRTALGATAVTLPWLAWSWYLLGSAIPDTLMVKSGIHWGPWSFANGPGLWSEKFPTATVLIAIPTLVGLVALPFWLVRPELRRIGAVIGFGALAHAGAMTALSVAPFHWYYAPSTGALTLLAALTCARIPRVAVAAAPVVALAAVCAGLVVASGVPPLTSNWATAAQYERIARQLPRGATIESPGEVGTLAYYCRCRVLDGLADRGSISASLRTRVDEATGFGGALLRLNYLNFEPVRPVPRDMRMTTKIVPSGTGAPMGTAWGPDRTWALAPVR
ncbi:hypothetical protein [Pseudonocardia endophytica]|uniref:hypothetical protein n=1 Tax=Pseudonocardia endophytica TaxID=401976 RepID=UPI00104E7FEE|nr:hypothetical protein [Pseudonocardia endophytica]